MTTTKEARSHLGVGLYSLAEVRRLTGAKVTTVRRWVGEDGLVPRYFDEAEKTLTFVELMEVFFIKMFRNEGVSLQTIRTASAVAARKFKTQYPFSFKQFDTDGKTIFATASKEGSDDEELVEDLKRGQYVFNTILRPFFHKLDYRGTREVVRYWPQSKAGRVVLDPQRKFGKPIDAPTGIPTRVFYDAVTAGGGQDAVSVAEWFGVPVAAVNAAVEFERSLAV